MTEDKEFITKAIQEAQEPLVFEIGKTLRMALNGHVEHFSDGVLYQQIIDREGSVQRKIWAAENYVKTSHEEFSEEWARVADFVENLSDEQASTARSSIEQWREITNEYK